VKKVFTPQRGSLPFHICLVNYLMELIFALLPSDSLSNSIKRWMLIVRGSLVGNRPKFGRRLWIDDYTKLVIGNNVFFNYDCILQATGGIQIDDDVLLAPGVTILSANHDIAKETLMRTGPAICKKVHVKTGAWLGGRCIITPGVTIGQGSVIAAGAVVVKDVAPYTVVGGNPAHFIKNRPHTNNVE